MTARNYLIISENADRLWDQFYFGIDEDGYPAITEQTFAENILRGNQAYIAVPANATELDLADGERMGRAWVVGIDEYHQDFDIIDQIAIRAGCFLHEVHEN
ncbi:hypothetical protein WCX49_01135 [Sulfurimonas sp. HSL-1656]|uniref:hypothetical protein n=1 Tax=Thiomicrolovo subterrani TaxID=3131934 RepID=UPI0031F93BCE